jgi:hypothetical protein
MRCTELRPITSRRVISEGPMPLAARAFTSLVLVLAVAVRPRPGSPVYFTRFFLLNGGRRVSARSRSRAEASEESHPHGIPLGWLGVESVPKRRVPAAGSPGRPGKTRATQGPSLKSTAIARDHRLRCPSRPRSLFCPHNSKDLFQLADDTSVSKGCRHPRRWWSDYRDFERLSLVGNSCLGRFLVANMVD